MNVPSIAAPLKDVYDFFSVMTGEKLKRRLK